MRAVEWDGRTSAAALGEDEAARRSAVAAAAKSYDWPRLLELLAADPALVNTTRPDGRALYAPLHQAAHGGAPVDVVARLIELGAWRTLRTARGERPDEVAARRGHAHLQAVLTPQYRRTVPRPVLAQIEVNFHAVIRERVDDLVRERALRLPDLGPLLEIEKPEMWFAVPGMYGGFSYRLAADGERSRLIADSWCRIFDGSGQRHVITAEGAELVEEGFV